MTRMRWAAWCNVIAGALLMVAPFALGYSTLSDIATYEAVALGLLIPAAWDRVGGVIPPTRFRASGSA
jgi:hypothetical protein